MNMKAITLEQFEKPIQWTWDTLPDAPAAMSRPAMREFIAEWCERDGRSGLAAEIRQCCGSCVLFIPLDAIDALSGHVADQSYELAAAQSDVTFQQVHDLQASLEAARAEIERLREKLLIEVAGFDYEIARLQASSSRPSRDEALEAGRQAARDQGVKWLNESLLEGIADAILAIPRRTP